MAFIPYASFQQIPIEINGLYTCECFSGGLWVQPPPNKSTTVVYEKYNHANNSMELKFTPTPKFIFCRSVYSFNISQVDKAATRLQRRKKVKYASELLSSRPMNGSGGI